MRRWRLGSFSAAGLWVVVTAVAGCNRAPKSAAGAIQISEATYGESCQATSGNVTQAVAASCNGQVHCDYKVDVAVLSDPAPDCPKDFVVRYRCAAAAPEKRVKVDAEAGVGSVASLRCE
jgi:hypothetical protein